LTEGRRKIWDLERSAMAETCRGRKKRAGNWKTPRCSCISKAGLDRRNGGRERDSIPEQGAIIGFVQIKKRKG